MTKYTLKDLNREARLVTKAIREETGKPAQLDHWELFVNYTDVTLAVIIKAYDGLRQRNVAI